MIGLIIVLAVVGFIVYLLTTYIPMPAPIKQTIIVAVVIIMILYILRLVVGDIPIPRLR
jgi:hypothetical protein